MEKWDKKTKILTLSVAGSYILLGITILALWVNISILSKKTNSLIKLSETYFEIVTNTDNFLSYKTDYIKTDIDWNKEAIYVLGEKIELLERAVKMNRRAISNIAAYLK